MKRTLFILSILFVIVACSNEDSMLNNVSMMKESVQTRAAMYESKYLDISTYSFASMTEDDFFRYSEAEKRMDMKFLENGLITTNDLCAEELYMSDSLYNFVHKVIDNSNKLYFPNGTDMIYHKTFAKRKSSSSPEPGESNIQKPDCVLLAIRHVNGNTKTYNQIKNYCDSVFPNWENQGGIATGNIQSIMNTFCNLNYTPIIGKVFRQKYNVISDTLKFYNKEVAAFERTGSGCKSNEDHCVNVYYLAPGNDKPHFYVCDYQNVAELVKPIDKLTCIFVAPGEEPE